MCCEGRTGFVPSVARVMERMRTVGPAKTPLLVRFLAKVHIPSDSKTACWEWTAAINENGYGVISEDGHGSRTLLAHRVAWKLANGSIPAGMVVRHRCDNPACVRPSHLELGTMADNQRDMAERCRGTRSKLGLPRGVRRSGRGWQARVKVAGCEQNLGTFDTIEHAADAVEHERRRIYSEKGVV